MSASALVRSVPLSFAEALAARPPDPPIDVARARAQHAAYVAALASLGLEVETILADEACPDCCFIEDAALVAGDVAILTRSAAASRRGEAEAVAPALAARAQLLRMPAPATLDGGDCLRLGKTIYVGRSARSNDAALAYLREVLGPRGFTIVPVAMPPGVLHLKSVCSPLADDLVLVAEGTLPTDTFSGARVIEAPAAEAAAANAVAFGPRVLVAADGRRTISLVTAAGFRVIPVDTSELRKADGALTCLSVIFA